MIEENPRNLEFSRKIGCESFHSKRFRGIMAAVQNIDPKFLGHRVRPMRTLARDKCVHPFFRGALEVSAGATCDNTDALADLRSGLNHQRPSPGCMLQPAG